MLDDVVDGSVDHHAEAHGQQLGCGGEIVGQVAGNEGDVARLHVETDVDGFVDDIAGSIYMVDGVDERQWVLAFDTLGNFKQICRDVSVVDYFVGNSVPLEGAVEITFGVDVPHVVCDREVFDIGCDAFNKCLTGAGRCDATEEQGGEGHCECF